MSTISAFMEKHFKHFNARETLQAAQAWRDLLDRGGQMFVTLAGAMSTGELGISLAEMIRAGKVHGICCTGANLEEDVFNLFGQRDYTQVPEYRDLTPKCECELRDKALNRVTDVCIPENIMLWSDSVLIEMWAEAAEKGEPKFPCEFMYALLDHPEASGKNHVPMENSWMAAAKEKNLAVFSPGWEDSTLGNMYCAKVMEGRIKNHRGVRGGTEQMQALAGWYRERCEAGTPVGFFQIGGGIAGDFPICVVPMLIQDCKQVDTPYWAYFCQISDAVTSYGGYSGAPPNEKITWHKLAVDTPTFMIQSDASIVAPMIFAYVLGW
ncbi:MAG: deoxyhypusine synthase family protein [Planctomycetota bacterium]|jgi:deoxyhypusine synthase